MTLPDRPGLIALLERLESEKDEDVLAAAREIVATKKQAGAGWDAVLDAVGHDGNDDAWDGTLGESADETESEDVSDPSDAADDAKLIATLLARDDLSESTRQDLLDFQADVARGPLGKSDSRYVRALHRRLIGGN